MNLGTFQGRFALATEMAPDSNRAQRRDLARMPRPSEPSNGRSNRSDAPHGRGIDTQAMRQARAARRRLRAARRTSR